MPKWYAYKQFSNKTKKKKKQKMRGRGNFITFFHVYINNCIFFLFMGKLVCNDLSWSLFWCHMGCKYYNHVCVHVCTCMCVRACVYTYMDRNIFYVTFLWLSFCFLFFLSHTTVMKYVLINMYYNSSWH